MDFFLFAGVVTLLTCFVIIASRIVHTSPRPRGYHGPGSDAADQTNENTSTANKFGATAIENKGVACAAVEHLLNIRLLDNIDPLPPLPLASCTMKHCNCFYVRYADRRDSGKDRRTSVSLQAQLFLRSGKADQRMAHCGRRISDLDQLVFEM